VNVQEREFKHETSVFKQWTRDNPNKYDEMANFEMQHWKIPKMIKD
jgi:hypothetical protein